MTSENHSSTPSTTIVIKHQHRKSMIMRVSAAGEVVVCIPKWVRADDPLVEQFIAHGIQKLEDRIPAEPATPLHTSRTIRNMISERASSMGLTLGRVQFREMTRKWGSCSVNGNITLNTSLRYLPSHLVEYVVMHELVHMLIFDHSLAFWEELAEYVPDYLARERELDSYRV